jgi:hypothetical protein
MDYNIDHMIESVTDNGLIILRADGRAIDKMILEVMEGGQVSLDIGTYYGGDGIPEAEWHRRCLATHVAKGPIIVDPDRLRAVLEQARPLVERVIAGHSVEWDGSNHVGRLTYDASEALDALDDLFARADLADEDWMLWTVADWIGSTPLADLGLDAGSDDEAIRAAAANLRHTARTDGVILMDDASLEDALRERVAEARAEAEEETD